MKLNYIVTLANAPVRLHFLAMERSLRATGCDLPLRVIPYDDRRFDLPPNAEWWEMPELTTWLAHHQAHPTMRKYQCLTLSNYHYVDIDLCFLRNPTTVLAPHSGFITSCGHWQNPDDTVTSDSQKILAARSTTWQLKVFNTGQFACDRQLFTVDEIIRKVEEPDFANTCLHFPYHEQPGLNLLVNSSDVSIHNLTLPPHNMQSTWAGDYPDGYSSFWHSEEQTPYLIHWAGKLMQQPRPIDQLFLKHLEPEELDEWNALLSSKQQSTQSSRLRLFLRRIRQAFSALRSP